MKNSNMVKDMTRFHILRNTSKISITLFHFCIYCKCVQIQIAARALGDIVRKLGERMLPELIPILERGLHSDDSAQRQGVCIGLSEIIKSCSKDAVSTSSVPEIRKIINGLAGLRLVNTNLDEDDFKIDFYQWKFYIYRISVF